MAVPIARDELQHKVAAGSILLVDAQAPGWYEQEHLPGALRAAINDGDGLLTALGDDLGAEIAVHCWNAACTGSAYVAEQLDSLGYRNVRRYAAASRTGSTPVSPSRPPPLQLFK